MKYIIVDFSSILKTRFPAQNTLAIDHHQFTTSSPVASHLSSSLRVETLTSDADHFTCIHICTVLNILSYYLAYEVSSFIVTVQHWWINPRIL